MLPSKRHLDTVRVTGKALNQKRSEHRSHGNKKIVRPKSDLAIAVSSRPSFIEKQGRAKAAGAVDGWFQLPDARIKRRQVCERRGGIEIGEKARSVLDAVGE